MRKQSIKVFDDFVYATAIDQVWTDASFNDTLGRFDQLSLIAVTDQVVFSTGATLNVQIEHSTDGRNWTTKNGSPEISGSITGAGATTLAGGDGGSSPSGGFVRLAVWLTNSATAAHVKIYACQRDQG